MRVNEANHIKASPEDVVVAEGAFVSQKLNVGSFSLWMGVLDCFVQFRICSLE